MSTTYFCGDGSYGDGHEVVMLVTKDWTPEDWEAVESANDYERMDVAMGIYLRKNAEWLTTVGEAVEEYPYAEPCEVCGVPAGEPCHPEDDGEVV